MDILSHSFTGIAVGTVLASFIPKKIKQKAGIILAGGFGGALPDIDAISKWSKFDSTIGAFLNLAHTGDEIYVGKLWYSHHGALHSITAVLFFLLLFLGGVCLIQKYSIKALSQHIHKYNLYYGAFFMGFFLHLLEDMPTPSSVWGGVNFFFPSKAYVGGYGKIWWWNNYDLFLIVCVTIFCNLFIQFLTPIKHTIKKTICITLFLASSSLFLYQINSRPFDFAYEGYNANYSLSESESLRIQKELLGETVFNLMRALDSKLPVYF